ncbi:MAG: AAA family ATPase [Magnetococcales bacterium]|nr:AAA family ATPase [Magnetococcales bacterium]
MRILQIRFKNLNSLVGEWQIDLTHPAYVLDGIFVITGPTGAGKSTLFDAICLALYGTTPRLGRISRSDNEIMSRLFGDCFAEVTFATPEGRFRCHWSQHRSRRKANGDLQPAAHEIAEADSGKILEEKLTQVPKRVEQLTGMDFDRFTRAMLLAQGRFAAFLHADGAERSALLEQITGTEIYSRISRRVHERRGSERRTYEILEAEVAGIRLLEKDEAFRLTLAMAWKRLTGESLHNRLDELDRAFAWLQGLRKLEEELRLLEIRKQDWQQRWTAFAPELERLRRAQLAMERLPRQRQVQTLRNGLAQIRQAHHMLLAQRPQAWERTRQAEQGVEQAREERMRSIEQQQNQSVVIRTARELDVRIHEKRTPLRQAEEGLAGVRKRLAATRGEQQQNLQRLTEHNRLLSETRHFLAQYPTDGELVSEGAVLLTRLEQWQEMHRQGSELAKAMLEWRQRQEELAQELGRQELRWHDVQARLSTLQQNMLEQERLRHERMEQRDPQTWRADLTRLQERRMVLERWLERLRNRQAWQSVLIRGQKQQQEQLVRHGQIVAALRAAESELSRLEQQRSEHEARLSRIQGMQSFAKVRQQLHAGEPCPVCGSTEHPFAAGGMPVVDETLAALQQVRQAWQQCHEQVQELRLRQVATAKDLEQIAARLQEGATVLRAAESADAEGLPGSVEEGERVLLENQHALAHAAQVVAEWDRLEKTVQTLRTTLETTREQVVVAERERTGGMHRHESSLRELERVRLAHQELEQRASGLRVELIDLLGHFGIPWPDGADCGEIRSEVVRRRERWLAFESHRHALEAEVARLEWEQSNRAGELERLASELSEREAVRHTLQEALEGLRQERFHLFGSQDPQVEEQRLAAAVVEAEKRLEAQGVLQESSRQAWMALETNRLALENRLDSQAGVLAQEEAVWQEELARCGFADEADCLAAVLPEAVRQARLEQERVLVDAQAELRALEAEKRRLWEREQTRKVTGQTLEVVQSARERCVERARSVQGELGGLQLKWMENAALQEQKAGRLQAVARQRQALERWEVLHGLIGSEDGKRYREFVQGLTFERVLTLANRQLRQMSDRYEMLTDPEQPLNIRIRDHHQAGEVRSARNLSGGETFLVSLALALGLSGMASRKIRVDALFLDEGFGTLDEESLEIALETLAGLRREGKLIGVISHVPALRERIRTRIRVTPRSGGQSTLSGPGCTQQGR